SQYVRERKKLPPSPYSLTHKASNGRGIYTFCMCPGGYVVNASSEEGHLCVNGMSYQKRDSLNANSALIVTVDPSDYQPFENDRDNGVLSGLAFQRELERRAYMAAGGKIPVQLYDDFRNGRASDRLGDVCMMHKGVSELTRIDDGLPPFLKETLIEGIDAFGRSIKGFDRPDALLSGFEARTSSPVRLERDETMQSSIRGVYPIGEGAGYAGGITSAAIDGMKAAEILASLYRSEHT
ncbi:MAG: FAD-dependent oxidoreductase, partial [Lachnospiraceae bacterium]|nr:FAD-dependent oxidoreductase [Candidatus Equihabitans merdae]